MSKLSRREFIRLLPAVSASLACTSLRPALASSLEEATTRPNIIILVLDAMSARNLSLYGYRRETTPHIARLAERATVYHAHYAAGNFTTPGTASILTGMYPWHHRAINVRGPIRRSLLNKHLFALVGPEYVRTAFTQNMLADVFLRQARPHLELHLPLTTFHLNNQPSLVSENFRSDPLIPFYAFDNSIVYYSVLSTMFLNFWNISTWKDLKQYALAADGYPYGTPFNTYNYFHNDIVYQGVKDLVLKLAAQNKPFLTYLHLFSPHDPYAPRKEFVDIFPELDIPRKPEHPLSAMKKKFTALLQDRKHYDEFIANIDAEVGLLINALDQAGILSNTYLFILADHGELSERGEQGHLNPLLYDPILHIPLLVFAPGQKSRRDVFTPTSNVDVLPTILEILGKDLPPAMDGRVLPGFGGEHQAGRSIFSIEAKRNSAMAPLTWASISIIKDRKKLIYYMGYPGFDDTFELYDLQDDMEESDNLFKKDIVSASLMKEELLDALAASNASLRRR
jgi:arylsulfatase A-like enzyme